jgi:hypothetical protein
MRICESQKTFSPHYISLHAVYYLMRKIALAYAYPKAQLQPALYSTLCTYSETDEERLEMLYLYLCDEASERERGKHGIEKPSSDWTEVDEADEGLEMGFVVAESWNYVHGVIQNLKDGRCYQPPNRDGLEEILGVADAVAV